MGTSLKQNIHKEELQAIIKIMILYPCSFSRSLRHQAATTAVVNLAEIRSHRVKILKFRNISSRSFSRAYFRAITLHVVDTELAGACQE